MAIAMAAGIAMVVGMAAGVGIATAATDWSECASGEGHGVMPKQSVRVCLYLIGMMHMAFAGDCMQS